MRAVCLISQSRKHTFIFLLAKLGKPNAPEQNMVRRGKKNPDVVPVRVSLCTLFSVQRRYSRLVREYPPNDRVSNWTLLSDVYDSLPAYRQAG